MRWRYPASKPLPACCRSLSACLLGRMGMVIPILCGTQEQHISADVAYAVWHYWQATEDTTFLLEAGAEIVLETARFWASRASLEDDGRFHIRRVIGPDEYHKTRGGLVAKAEAARSGVRLRVHRSFPPRDRCELRPLSLIHISEPTRPY